MSRQDRRVCRFDYCHDTVQSLENIQKSYTNALNAVMQLSHHVVVIKPGCTGSFILQKKLLVLGWDEPPSLRRIISSRQNHISPAHHATTIRPTLDLCPSQSICPDAHHPLCVAHHGWLDRLDQDVTVAQLSRRPLLCDLYDCRPCVLFSCPLLLPTQN